MIQNVTVIKHQTLFDISLMVYGNIEGVFALCLANDVSITESLKPGQLLIVPEFTNTNNEIVAYYKAKQITPATGLTDQEIKIINLEDDSCNYCKLFE